jgi:hypothetical protein
MSTNKSTPNQAQPPTNNAWEDAKREVRDRNDKVRSTAKREREEERRRADAARRARDLRDGVAR